MKKKSVQNNPEFILLEEISKLIERERHTIASHANRTTIFTFWCIGKRINEDILQNKRADYGNQIVSLPATQLSWSHFIKILPLKTQKAKLFYLNNKENVA